MLPLRFADFNLKIEVNQKSIRKLLENGEKKGLKISEAPSQRYESPADLQGLNLSPWTNEEQQLLEQALKTYPATVVNRWDLIADSIPNRSKRDCVKRYKELVEIIKAKKAAQLAAQNAVHNNSKKS